MGKDRVLPRVFVKLHTESDVFEWEAINDLREGLFCDIRGEQVRHGSRKCVLMICIENLAHATCVNVLGGRNSRPPRVVVHFVVRLVGLLVVVLKMRHRVDRPYLCGKERVVSDLTFGP